MAELLRRKLTLALYPTPKQEVMLQEWIKLHCQLYNAALEERIDAWRKFKKNITYIDQQNLLPLVKELRPDLVPLGSQALQETLRRLDRAFSAFYRRCAAGETPGFPRFRSAKRFKSFCYPSPAGWCYIPLDNLSKERPHPEFCGPMPQGRNARTAYLKIADMLIRARGMGRFASFEANDLTVKRIGEGKWEASITLRVSEQDCHRERTGNAIRGFDQGLTDRFVFDDGQTIPNSRHLQKKLDALAQLQQSRDKCKRHSRNYKRLTVEIARLHRKVAFKRKDELHKISTELVMTCSVLATEELALANLIKAPQAKPEKNDKGELTGKFLPNGAAAKAGLNREMASAGMGLFLQMMEYKAEEACTKWSVANTRKLKPTQRCAHCGTVVKKQLDERTHMCTHCSFTTSRDRNAALVCLIDGLWPAYYDSRKGKGKFFAPDGFVSLIRNKLYYAHQELDSPRNSAHGTGAVRPKGRTAQVKPQVETPP